MDTPGPRGGFVVCQLHYLTSIQSVSYLYATTSGHVGPEELKASLPAAATPALMEQRERASQAPRSCSRPTSVVGESGSEAAPDGARLRRRCRSAHTAMSLTSRPRRSSGWHLMDRSLWPSNRWFVLGGEFPEADGLLSIRDRLHVAVHRDGSPLGQQDVVLSIVGRKPRRSEPPTRGVHVCGGV